MRGQHAAVRPRLPGDCPPGSAGQRAGSGRERAAVKVLGVAIHSGWLSWQPAAFVAVLFLCLSLSVHTFHPTQRWPHLRICAHSGHPNEYLWSFVCALTGLHVLSTARSVCVWLCDFCARSNAQGVRAHPTKRCLVFGFSTHSHVPRTTHLLRTVSGDRIYSGVVLGRISCDALFWDVGTQQKRLKRGLGSSKAR
jgi:hypothetical protein